VPYQLHCWPLGALELLEPTLEMTELELLEELLLDEELPLARP
jgi:hypothetical protein